MNKWIKQKTIFEIDADAFDKKCNDFRLQHQCIATQTHSTEINENLVFSATIFYEGES